MKRQAALVVFLEATAIYFFIVSLGVSGSWAHAINAFFSIQFGAVVGWMVRDYSARKVGAGGTAPEGHNAEFRPLDAASSRPVAPGTQG